MEVIISAAAQRDIDRLSPAIIERVIRAIRSLSRNPRPPRCLVLRNYEPLTWRLRVGDWRILYEIDDRARVVTVTGVRHRSEAY